MHCGKLTFQQKNKREICGIGEATIKKYELGIRNPKQEQIRKIANALNIPVSYKHLRPHETNEHLLCRLNIEKKKGGGVGGAGGGG